MKKKIIAGTAISISVIVILLSSLFMQATPSYAAYVRSLPTKNTEAAIAATPTPIPGNIFTGIHLRIGINQGGTLGVGNGSDPGTGFQYPIGPQYESLAWAWWGDGYVVAYKTEEKPGVWVDNVAYWQPGLGWPPPAACNIRPVSHTILRRDDNMIVVRTVVQTADGYLQLRFDWMFPPQQKYVILNTQIMNIHKELPVRDVVYKRFVDWDIHQVIYNDWTSDAHSAYASYFNPDLNWRYVFTISGSIARPFSSRWNPYAELYGWDDYMTRDPFETIQSHELIQNMDGAAMIHFKMGGWWSIRPGVGFEADFYYQASESYPSP